MAFDWVRFFDTNRVEYSDRGSNVSRGHVVIHCPFCGTQDQGQHLSVNLDGKGWRCFRHVDHRGKSPVKLVAALIGCTLDQAARMTGQQVFIPDDYMARLNSMLRPAPISAESERKGLILPPEFKRFKKDDPGARYFNAYLEGRGYDRRSRLLKLMKMFDLRYCKQGQFSQRIIFPIVKDGRIDNWTGRSIKENPFLRYRTLSTDAEASKEQGLPAALGPITDYLLWADQLKTADADTIYVVEGPFDALKIWYLAYHEGIVATCLFTSSISSSQVDGLHEILPRFKNRFLMLDQNTFGVSMRIRASLAGLGVQQRQLPNGIKDPGELSDGKILWSDLD